MRLLIVGSASLVLAGVVACSDPPPATTCPADDAVLVAGVACNVVAELRCVHGDGQTCGAGWGGTYRCACVDGAWACDDPTPTDGAACDWPAGTSCSREGNPDCVTMPTGGWCTCADGVWTCGEACWHQCPAHWDPTWLASPPACSTPGEHCPLPGGHTCDCDGAHYACR